MSRSVLWTLLVVSVGCEETPQGHWISGLSIDPPVIRIHEGESARISFVVRDRQAAALGFARHLAPRLGSVEVEIRDGAAYRSFIWRFPGPGYKVAIWDGTFTGMRSQPPRSGTFAVSVTVTDEWGRTERVMENVRLSNPRNGVVLPRSQSGLRLSSLRFDGSYAVLTDERGDSIRVRAVSGLKPQNPENPAGVDYTEPRYQWVEGRGPIPEGVYFIRPHDIQHPELVQDLLIFASGVETNRWGPIRVPLEPRQIGNRTGFFLHLDPQDDGTAGCIGVHPDDEGKFNQIMSLISWMPNDRLPVIVKYPTRESVPGSGA